MKPGKARIAFCIFNYLFIGLLTLICFLPIWQQLVISLSDNNYAMAGMVTLWPKGFSLDAYAFLIENSQFFKAVVITLERVVLGTALNMTLCILTAYPLSKSNDQMHFRTAYVWFFAITMFISGGMIPTYIAVAKTKIINTIWALLLPGALATTNMVMMLNFFRGIPKALEESAFLDGAGHMKTLLHIYLPMSMPSIATILLFTLVSHWNNWFDGFIYINRPKDYPLATYLYAMIKEAEINTERVVSSAEEYAKQRNVSSKTVRTAQLFLAALPIMSMYPFLQRYFVKGIVLGSVKE